VAAVHKHNNLWAEITVGTVTKVTLPRTKLSVVPYALQAASATTAENASGKLKADIESLAKSKTSPTVFKFGLDNSNPAISSGKFATGGGKLLITAIGNFTAITSQGAASDATFFVDGKKVATTKGDMMYPPSKLLNLSVVIDNVAAGAHFIEMKKTGCCPVFATVTIVELPK